MSGVPESYPIDVPSITDLIYHKLREDISHGIYKPGPIRIGELAERFRVSSIPVREALRRLEAEGLVSLDRRRRILINAFSEVELDEIFAVRSELEALATERATPNLATDPAALEGIQRLADAMDRQEADPDAWRRTNSAFHSTIYQAAHMPRLESIIGSLWVAGEPYIRLYVSAVDSLRLAQEQHRELVEHIRANDAGVSVTGSPRAPRRDLGSRPTTPSRGRARPVMVSA